MKQRIITVVVGVAIVVGVGIAVDHVGLHPRAVVEVDEPPGRLARRRDRQRARYARRRFILDHP